MLWILYVTQLSCVQLLNFYDYHTQNLMLLITKHSLKEQRNTLSTKASLFEVPDIWNILPCNLDWNIAPIFGFGHIQHVQRASCCGITIQQKWRYVNSFRCLFILIIFWNIFFECQHHFSPSFRQHFAPSVKRPFIVTAPDISFKDTKSC